MYRSSLYFVTLLGVMASCAADPVDPGVGRSVAAETNGGEPEEPTTSTDVPDDGVIPDDAVFADAEITGYDRTVAANNGYEIRVGADGNEYSVVKGAPRDALPADFARGNCGVSFVYEVGTGNRCVNLRTGFTDLARPAVSYSWLVHLHDRGGSSTQRWSGGLFFRTSWQGIRNICGLTAGPAWSQVDSVSNAVLVTGAICHSLAPTSSATIR
jgi:hypothetical protein